MAFLQGPSLKQAEMIKQELGEGPGDMERCVRDLRSMLAASPHLPDSDCFGDSFLEIFICGCRMNMERARTKLESYCLARARYRDMYGHLSLNEPPMSDVCNFIDILALPKLTDEGLRVTIFRIKQNYPDGSADVAAAARAILLTSDVRMNDEKMIAGDVFIYECSQVRGSIVPRVAAAIGSIRRSIYLAQAAYPQRLKRVHVVGAAPFLASSLALMRNLVNEKVRKRYYIHAKIDDLFEHIPARVLPAEWGGEEESIEVITKKWRKRIDENRDFLRNLNEACQRAPTPSSDTDIYGTVGAFRKLDID